MVEVAVINGFHNHDSLFYPIKTQMSIPGLSLKIPVIRDFNQEFNLLSPIILLYNMRNFLVITGSLSIFIRYNSKFFLSSNKASQKKFNSMLSRADSCRFCLFALLKCDRCVNTGKPAAFFGFPLQIKVVEYQLQEATAAGLLGGLVSKVGEVVWNDVVWLHGHWEGLEGRALVIGHLSLGKGIR